MVSFNTYNKILSEFVATILLELTTSAFEAPPAPVKGRGVEEEEAPPAPVKGRGVEEEEGNKLVTMQSSEPTRLSRTEISTFNSLAIGRVFWVTLYLWLYSI